MEDNRKSLKIKESEEGEIRISDEVVQTIVGLAATEVDGVNSLGGNLTGENIVKTGVRNLSKGVKVEVTEEGISADLAISIKYGFAIPEVSKNVQERVRTAIETMTGLQVAGVNVRVSGVTMAE